MRRQKIVLLLLFFSVFCYGERRAEPILYGDMEHWVVRYIKESSLLGGATRLLYALGPTDTIRTNGPFVYGQHGSVWSSSNAYAKVVGIEKGACSARPEYRDAEHGYCCRLDVELQGVKVLGIVNVEVLVSGTLFTGKTLEPITSSKDPYSNVDFGVPFTRRPVGLQYDYKCTISSESWVWEAKGFNTKRVDGVHADAEVYMLLQKRWEDKEGNIHALRVGTAHERFFKTQATWVNNHFLPMHYGDITAQPFYKEYMGLNKPMRALNSRGEVRQINEEGWAAANEQPTHMIIMITSSTTEVFVGHAGNTFWVDNIKLIYE